jgi:hypothetical protein
MERLLLKGALCPMPAWMRWMLRGAIGFAIPVVERVYVWPAECGKRVSLAALLVHEHHHLEDGWRAWIYAAISLWNTRLREHGAYAAELAFLDQWRSNADGETAQAIEERAAWVRRVLRSLEIRGRLP